MGLVSFNLVSFILLAAAAATFSSTPRRAEGVSTSFKIENGCGYKVWPAFQTGSGTPPSTMADGRTPGGFMLKSNEVVTINVPHGWSGRLWGRTGCNFTSDGVGKCQSGDCGGKLDCGGVGGTAPATLIEFTLQGLVSNKDFYDVSLVDGYNLPITITPGGLHTNANKTSCGVAGCLSDLNKKCPSQLQVLVDNDVVGCKSACLALQKDQYCCSGAYNNPTTCKASSYSSIFKSACPNAYTYAYDDPSSLFTCTASNYTIIFCPSSSSQASESSGTTKDHLGKLWAYVGIAFLLLMYFNTFHDFNK